jgi:hypothetical protein
LLVKLTFSYKSSSASPIHLNGEIQQKVDVLIQENTER